MSPGVIAAIVVGSVMGFLLMIIIPITCCRCKSRHRSSQGTVLDPALVQPPSYGSSAARSNAPYDSSLIRNTVQDPRPLHEPSSSNRRYTDPPPVYKAN